MSKMKMQLAPMDDQEYFKQSASEKLVTRKKSTRGPSISFSPEEIEKVIPIKV
jgi:hypothetical protein